MRGREPLSVAIITHNEAHNIERCLASVAWADEIVVVDAESSDGTREIAARYTQRVYCETWRGFVAQKNLAVERTNHRWVLSLDADEWLSVAGAAEIRATLERPWAVAYALNRSTELAGAVVRHAWSPDWQVRLFCKDRARFAGGRVHESLVVDGRVARLRTPLHHRAYRSIHDYVERMNRYTDLAAHSLDERNGPMPWWRLACSPAATFLKFYLLRRGFLDGVRGLVVSAGSAYYVLLKYAKLWERRQVAGRGAGAPRKPPAQE